MLSMAPRVSFVVFALSLLLGIASAIDVYREMGFSYSGTDGPNNWGKLDPTFSPCSVGKRQSPIDIRKNLTVHNKQLKSLSRVYKPVNATLVNKGYSVGVRFEESAGDLWIDGKSYKLKQIHWHLPSEHRIDGQEFAAELHMVHLAPDNSTAVVAVLYQEANAADPFICKLMGAINKLGKENSEVPLGTLSINELNRKSSKYYKYVGSLTTPPCTEDIKWSILGKVMSISKEQIAAMDSPLNSNCKRNARPCQPLNGREVDLYDELSC
ncbi:A. THALIANA ALPHA CARBONIC ANHYDRASE 1, CARBONIC ANHYDRASE 1, alpha carbonic anhydrase 1 [Hibiscus trionum]|uniref:Carbonic anhydrase n=1 Tax=Hibiscus trionum TaxID=183268 RepID=A0A9W7LHE8_HIBTR|nr:A. THALIANA ALPHA CARBONIC ANHYDRASE 1, CARBONIC ANHYDRASE 1, alpha carbonic anhydrase 1 [Hibiscus trionum]